ncbi:FtsK/SpoIIIE domain-containing protein [Mycobacteroides abscessus]|uniref:FtsK/SpoIIIE domain-containing protein n=1 Tax=Mycobacteroides abscessus TaxID=36809 RepID=UPI001EEF2886|nr:FtsK/SpoIIIE domain-containing protein [Mycobacteroides abscessus]
MSRRKTPHSVTLGINEEGAWEQLRFTDSSGMLVAGIPGSGKTAMVRGLVAGHALTPYVQMLVLDPKAADLLPLAPRAYKYVPGTDEAALETVRDSLVELTRVMQARVENATSLLSDTTNFWRTPPSAAHPLVMVVVDEAQRFLDTNNFHTKRQKEIGAEIKSLLQTLVMTYRSAGCLVILCTPRPSFDQIPTSLRDSCAIRVSFNVMTRESAEAVLGTWAIASEISPIGLPQGVGVATAQGSPLVRFRTRTCPRT